MTEDTYYVAPTLNNIRSLKHPFNEGIKATDYKGKTFYFYTYQNFEASRAMSLMGYFNEQYKLSSFKNRKQPSYNS